MEKELLELIASELNVNQVSIESSMKSEDNWDSLSHIGIIIAIEEKFKISIHEEDILKLNSVKSILNHLNNEKLLG